MTPDEWIKGSLLNLRRYHDGSFIATLLGEDINKERTNCMQFDSAFAAQQFVSQWYQNECPDPRA